MVHVLTKLNVSDNSGAFTVQCIKLYNLKKREGKIGDIILVSIKTVNPKKARFTKGLMRWAVIVRTKNVFKRGLGIYLRFAENAVILLNRRKAPFSKRIKGYIPHEISENYKFIATIAKRLI